ncbi:MAG: hypothetical protein QM650_01855 [Microlunatus sp.]
MPNVLVRDVPPEDLELIRSAAAGRGSSLQGYLRDAIHAQAVYLRRQAAIADLAERLEAQPEVPESERAAVLVSIDRTHNDRADQLSSRSDR